MVNEVVRIDSIDKIGFSISDNDGRLRDMNEVIEELSLIYKNFSTHAMSDHALTLHGQKEMLGKIIEYLERI